MKNKLGSMTQKMWFTVIAIVVLGLLSISVFSQEKQSGRKTTTNQAQGKQSGKAKSDQEKKGEKGGAKGAGPSKNEQDEPCVLDGDSEPKIAMETGSGKNGPAYSLYKSDAPIPVTIVNCGTDFDLPVKFVLKGKGSWPYRFVEVPNSRVSLANSQDKGKVFTVETTKDCEGKSVIGQLRINKNAILRRANFQIKVELLQSANGNIGMTRQTGAAVPASGWQVRKSFTFIVDCGSTRIAPQEAKPTPIKQ